MIASRIAAGRTAEGGPGCSPDDIDLPGACGMSAKTPVLGYEGHSKIPSGGVDQSIRWITWELPAVKLAGPCRRLWCESRRRGTTILHHQRDPVPQRPIKPDPTIASQQTNLPPRNRADQDPVGVLDRVHRLGRQARPTSEPPHEGVGVDQDAQRIPSSASHFSPVEK